MAEIERTVRGVSAVVQPAIAEATASADSRNVQRPYPKKRERELTADQVAQLKMVFSRIDSNGDGDISKSEIMSALSKDGDLCATVGIDLHPTATSEERMFEAGMLFRDMDTDGNSNIDVDEFVAFFGTAPESLPEGVPESGAGQKAVARP